MMNYRSYRGRLQRVASLSSVLVALALVGCDADPEALGLDDRDGTPVLDPGHPPLNFSELGEYPALDQTGNNLAHPDWGTKGAPLLRLAPAAYSDGVGAPSGVDRPSPRVISNAVADQGGSIPNSRGVTDVFWLWGQFVDHDIDITPTGGQSFPIPVPTGDPVFDPNGVGNRVIAMSRSVFETINGQHEQPNEITGYIDGSNVYGSNDELAESLRRLDGSGELATSEGDLLPMVGGSFVAGDERVNEHIFLTSMHTLWMREHNYWARFFKTRRPWLDDDDVYFLARAVVAAEIQVITYEEFLPLLVGKDTIAPYTGYDPDVNAGIANEFSTAAYRLGHSLLNGTLLRLEPSGAPIAAGPIALRDAFFNPAEVAASGGITPLLRGIVGQTAQELDSMIVDDVRNFLFSNVDPVGFDLASLNMNRGRDHGLPDYNTVRVALGLDPVESFADITSDQLVQGRLAAAYDDVDDMDLWMAGLAEDHVGDGMLGETFTAIVAEQFTRSRDGDRFWYQNVDLGELRAIVENTRLSTVIRRNTEITRADIPYNVFLSTPPPGDPILGFEDPATWHSTDATLVANDDIGTDGARSLEVLGSGYRVLTSDAFGMPAAQEIWIDVYVPADQPNPYWTGQIQAFVECPAAGLYNAYVDEAELTGMPLDNFNVAKLEVPAAVTTALASNPAAMCQLRIALNANGTVTPYALDRVRFRG